MSDLQTNLRFDPNTGVLAATDTALSWVAGDPNEGSFPNLLDIAYVNHFLGTTVTTLYGIETLCQCLVRIGGIDGSPSPNLGKVSTVGPLGVSLSTTAIGGFDVQPVTNTAYAALSVSGSSFSNLYSISLATGTAQLLGTIGSSLTNMIHGLAIAPVNPCLDLGVDGRVDALTDGLMYMRALFGLTGTAVTTGALPSPAPPRANWGLIRTFMNTYCGMSFKP